MHYRYYSNQFSLDNRVTPATRLILTITVVVFLLDWLTRGILTSLFALSLYGIKHFNLWQPLTYQFLHAGFWHLLLNMLGLFFLGPQTERAIGSRRFIRLYLMSGVLGGLGWLLLQQALSADMHIPCVGASGAVFGVIAAFAALFPRQKITLLLFFILPITIQARNLAIGLGVMTLFMMFTDQGNIAHAAHLAGGLTGWIYIKFLLKRPVLQNPFNVKQWWHDVRWRWARRNFKVLSDKETDWETPAEQSAYPPSNEEVDRVLGKISRFGLKALTEAERDILQRASRKRK